MADTADKRAAEPMRRRAVRPRSRRQMGRQTTILEIASFLLLSPKLECYTVFICNKQEKRVGRPPNPCRFLTTKWGHTTTDRKTAEPMRSRANRLKSRRKMERQKTERRRKTGAAAKTTSPMAAKCAHPPLGDGSSCFPPSACFSPTVCRKNARCLGQYLYKLQ